MSQRSGRGSGEAQHSPAYESPCSGLPRGLGEVASPFLQNRLPLASFRAAKLPRNEKFFRNLLSGKSQDERRVSNKIRFAFSKVDLTSLPSETILGEVGWMVETKLTRKENKMAASKTFTLVGVANAIKAGFEHGSEKAKQSVLAELLMDLATNLEMASEDELIYGKKQILSQKADIVGKLAELLSSPEGQDWDK